MEVSLPCALTLRPRHPLGSPGPLIPVPLDTHPLGVHRRRKSGRECSEVMLVHLTTGCSWEDAERLCTSKVSDTTCAPGATSGSQRGSSTPSWTGPLWLGQDRRPLPPDVAVEASLHKSPCGGEGTGKNPTDRAKLGHKWSILTDKNGIPSTCPWTAPTPRLGCSPRTSTTLRSAAYSRRSRPSGSTGAMSEATRQRLIEREIADAIMRRSASERPHTAQSTTSRWGWVGSRADQVMAVQVRSAPQEHGSEDDPSSCPVRPGGRLLAHRKADRLEKSLVSGLGSYPLSLLAIWLDRCGPVEPDRHMRASSADGTKRQGVIQVDSPHIEITWPNSNMVSPLEHPTSVSIAWVIVAMSRTEPGHRQPLSTASARRSADRAPQGPRRQPPQKRSRRRQRPLWRPQCRFRSAGQAH